ncbi:MAG: rhomboid family intramembrane serine protease [Bacteroidales bacterium]|jgi:membrane associated rhomboid family serine protease|nr:rhomboid family intramembrane serine protease [Bacteroidales bacterium]
MKVWEHIQQEFKRGNNLTRIIYVNVGVFVFLRILNLLAWMFTGSPSSGVYAVFIDNLQTYLNPSFLLYKPWTMLTYMFTHEGFLHILFNMLWLYWMGRIFIDLLNGKRLLAIYLLGGFAGAVLALLAFNFLPALSQYVDQGNAIPMLGASGAVMAITVAIGTYVPDYRIRLIFVGETSLKYIVIIAVAIDILFLPDGNAGGRFAHLGGAAFGFLWAYKLKKGTDISKWFMNLLDTIAVRFKPKKQSNMHVSYRNKQEKKGKETYVQYEEANSFSSKKTENYSQAEIDVILDKVAKTGYESLTKREKEILFSSSNRK